MTKKIFKWMFIMMALFLPFRLVFNDIDDFISIIFIAVLSLVIIISNIRNEKKYIIIFSLLLRIIFIVWDIKMSNIFQLPNSGKDSSGFYNSIIRITGDYSLIFQKVYGGLYVKILSIMTIFLGRSRYTLQFINTLIGMIIIDITFNTISKTKIEEKTKDLLYIIIAFFPQTIIFSSILLRENFITLFNLLAFYFLYLWIKNKGKIQIVFAIMFILLASLFHSGSILGLLGILLVYGWRSNFLLISNKIIKTFIFVFIFIMFYISFKEVFFSQFLKIDSLEDILDLFDISYGNSAYLTNINPENIFQVILWFPILFIYFLAMPLPYAFRDGMDLISFIFDSSFYIFFVYQLFKNRKTIKESKYGVLILFIFLPLIVFSIGVRNTGTAIRHRHKFFPAMVMYLAIIWNEKTKLSNKDKEVEDAKNEIYIKNS